MSASGVTGDEEDVITFFHGLPSTRRREYEALAELDRRFGEDVVAERRAGGLERKKETS